MHPRFKACAPKTLDVSGNAEGQVKGVVTQGGGEIMDCEENEMRQDKKLIPFGEIHVS